MTTTETRDTTTRDGGAVRCSTADREAVSARLHAAAGEGRLTMDEVEERLTAVYAAKFHHELDATTVDLPRTATPRTGWRAVLTQVLTQLLADLTILLGRTQEATKPRRALRLLVLAGAAILLGGLVFLAIHGFVDGGEHPGPDEGPIGH